jgi:hypothetical protein
MPFAKSKRKRPNLDTANDYNESGGFLIDPKIHYFSDEERIAEVEEISDELVNWLPKQFPRTQNLEYAILKSHLIVEHVILQYIRCHANVVVDTNKSRFSFSQKLEIAYLMGFGANDPILIPCVELLNKARNQVAHKFSMDRNIIDELLRIVSGPDDPWPTETDRNRISGLRHICKWICGYTAGYMESDVHFQIQNKEIIRSMEGDYWEKKDSSV